MIALLLLSQAQAARADYTLEDHCLGNAWESCFIYVDGTIDAGMIEEFRELVRTFEGPTVYLNSPGGNLLAAVEMGRIIREAGLNTAIGSRANVEIMSWGSPEGFPVDGVCESACAYLFMGGVLRFMEDGRLGMHRFYSDSRELSSAEAQVLSGELVTYLVEMGIDARLFYSASREAAQDMFYVSREDALDYNVVTQIGFGPFFLEPSGDGVIAISDRLHPVTPYSRLQRITFLCVGEVPQILMSASGGDLGSPPLEYRVGLDDAIQTFLSPKIRMRDGDGEFVYTVTLSDAAAAIASEMLARGAFYVDIPFPRVAGWTVAARLQLSEMDVDMIESAWRHCIG